jgi:site-specific DNA-methyltransferase (adenine-specific)
MRLTFAGKADFHRALSKSDDESMDIIVLVVGAFQSRDVRSLEPILRECVRTLKQGGLFFIQGSPEYLPEIGVYLDSLLTFKYWIAIESTIRRDRPGLPSVHAGLLLFTKGNKFNLEKVRIPHQICAFCDKPLKDWGGKTHLMHPKGRVLSDVWRHLPPANNYLYLSKPVLDTILALVDKESSGIVGFYTPSTATSGSSKLQNSKLTQLALAHSDDQMSVSLPSDLVNVVYHGDILEVLRLYPDNSVDLVFADPPYNLGKGYSRYNDGCTKDEYIAWCKAWLDEYIRVLKPSGSLYVLNMPRWAMHLASFLNKKLYFQNWIVWDALSEPRGKLMPAHYSLLFYTKHPTNFTFNYGEIGCVDSRKYCLRASCIKKRKLAGDDEKEPLTDIWSDIHRVKHRRDRDYHPCQLPEALMERIVKLSTKPGDVVLDALCGVGTTLIAAAKLGRRYIGVDIDAEYVEITRQKLAEVERNGCIVRPNVARRAAKYKKKDLQLELQRIAKELGRLPTPEDVRAMSKYDIDVYFELFPTWGKALKAAKIAMSEA